MTEGRQNRIVEQYSRVIDDLFYLVCHTEEYDKERDSVLNEKFLETILPKIYKMNGNIKINLDRKLVDAIIVKVEEASREYNKFTFNKNFKAFEKKLQYLKTLGNTFFLNKFILRKDKQRIDKTIYQVTNLKQFKLLRNLNLLEQSSDILEFRSDFFDSANIQVKDFQSEEEVIEAYQMFYRFAFKDFDKKLLIKVDQLISKFQDRQQMLGVQLIQKIDEYLQNDIGKDDEEIYINQQLRRLALEESLDSNVEHKARIQELYQYLEKILKRFSGLKMFHQDNKVKFHLARFGSNVSGFASKSTDLDLTILTDCYIDQKNLLRILYKFLQAELKQKFKQNGRNVYKIQLRENARIPLIKLDFRKTKQIEFHFDIIINNILGVINSKFLSVYGSIPWIRELGILVKMWGKNKDLVSEWKFSSYSLNILLLHFLIETRKINLIMDARSRQESAPNFIYKRAMKNQMQSFQVFYQFKTNPSDVTSLKRANLFQILTEFFDYYKSSGGHWKLSQVERIITLDGSKKKAYDQEFIFTMKDPFDQTHNPGRVKVSQINNIMQAFQNASNSMKVKTWDSIRDLFLGTVIS